MYNLKFALAGLLCCCLLQACDRSDTTTDSTSVTPPVQDTMQPTAAAESAAPLLSSDPDQNQFNIGNKSYLFDVSNHSVSELEALLQRAEEINQFESDSFDQLKIVMILHGPDIDLFRQMNYSNNRKMVDLAARLDSFDIIDMKVCETSMANRGVKREEVPDFIESVPYSPDEMKRLLREGYINL